MPRILRWREATPHHPHVVRVAIIWHTSRVLVGGKALAEDTAGDNGHYWAFISYSHRDAAFGRRLHRKLETYALPRRLVGRAAKQGVVPRKLAPIFRDREELPAAHDLTTEVRTALKASRSLIVVCSPAAAASYWVGREIEVFRELHPDRPILAAIRDGEPPDCFPPALQGAGPDRTAIVPLAADFRRGRDGEHLGLLRLVAGMIGLGLDELIQRDNQRRNRRVTAVTATSMAGMLVMGVLTGFALNARQDAERQRGEALGLVKFMSTDLRDSLRSSGRPELMGAVNERALKFFDQESDEPSTELLAGRAQALQAKGEDDESHDNRIDAIKRDREAWAITNAQLAAAPNDPERIFDHAQSEYWIGFLDYSQSDYAGARRKFETYVGLAGKLVALEPRNPRSWRELAYAEGVLCQVYLHVPKKASKEPRQNPWAGYSLCSTALVHMRIVKVLFPNSRLIENDLANRVSWLGSADRAIGDNEGALARWLIQQEMLKKIRSADPLNVFQITAWIALQRNLARVDLLTGHSERYPQRQMEALTLIDQIVPIDNENTSWTKLHDNIVKEAMLWAINERKLAEADEDQGRSAQAQLRLSTVIDLVGKFAGEMATWIDLQRKLAKDDAESGQTDKARKRLASLLELIDAVAAANSGDATWTAQRGAVEKDLSQIKTSSEGKKL